MASANFLPAIGLMAVCAMTGTAGIAFAQMASEGQTGSHIVRKSKPVDPSRAGEIRHGLGRCIVAQKAEAVERLLLNSDPVTVPLKEAGFRDADDLSEKLGMPICLSKEANAGDSALALGMNGVALRGLLAEHMYLRKQEGAPFLPTDATQTTDRTYASQGEALAQATTLATFADCVTFKDTPDADALLRTRAGTAEEIAAARVLAPALGSCLVEGSTMKLTPKFIRQIVADGMWQRYARPTAQAATLSQ